MTDRPKVLAIIPARGGSKGLPKKNVRDLFGRPLIQWTIDAALNASCIDKIEVTSDSEEVLNIAAGNPGISLIKRPSSLSTDQATSIDVVRHALKNNMDFEYFILLQPTSPLRDSNDIDKAYSLMRSKGQVSCVSIVEVFDNPFNILIEESDLRFKPMHADYDKYKRRQELPRIFRPNGAIYINDINQFLQSRRFIEPDTIGYLMQSEKSIDIDTEKDFEQAIAFFKNSSAKENEK